MGKLVSMNFRTWLQEMWMQHKEELLVHGQKRDYEMADYFRKYKYWLKRQYRYEKGNKNV